MAGPASAAPDSYRRGVRETRGEAARRLAAVRAAARSGTVSVPAYGAPEPVPETGAAGGTSAGAVLTALNLARPLADGEQIVVPGPGDPTPVAGAGGPPPGGAASSGGPAAGPLDLNTATQAGLDGLPGIGPVLAERIVAWRTQHGRFTSVDEL